MKKQRAALAILLILLLVMVYRNLSHREVQRVAQLTHKTGEQKGIDREGAVEPVRLRKELFPPERKPFRMGNKGIFEPLGFAPRVRAEAAAAKPSSPLAALPDALHLEVGQSAPVTISNAAGGLITTFSMQGTARAEGAASPLTFFCLAEGVTTASVTDGKGVVSLGIACNLRPQEKKLAGFTFLGFLKAEKEKTIFLSRMTDKEIFVVKKGDVLIQKGINIQQDYVVKEITDDRIVIISADGNDLLEISLVENEPLRKK